MRRYLLDTGIAADYVHGRPVALVSRLHDNDADWLERELDPAFIASLVRARQQVKDGRTKSLADVKADLGIVTD